MNMNKGKNQIMKSEDVKKHWDSWANEFELELRSTTKEINIKRIELNAIEKFIHDNADVLNIGCGNGYDLIYFASKRKISAKGIDISENMIRNAKKLIQAIDQGFLLPESFKKVIPSVNKEECKKIEWEVADILSYRDNKRYDIVFTIRCIINLTDIEKQKKAIKKIADLVKKDGYFLMMENSIQNYALQNKARVIAGLRPRIPPAFNLFIDEEVILPEVKKFFDVEPVIDHSSLNNIFQYIILPSVEDKIYYDTPIMNKVTELIIELNNKGLPNNFSNFGQGKLWILRKK
jgi:SAM-dependent methyltransferase